MRRYRKVRYYRRPRPAYNVNRKLLHLHVYTMLLDSCQSEHAARMIAMQTATDNGDNMLSELTLEYNKSRQAKITAEILDLAGGAQE